MEKIKWLTVKDLQKYIIGGPKKIYSALEVYKKKNINAIGFIETSTRKSVCLNEVYLKDFITKTGLISREENTKTSDWMCTKDLSRHVYGSFDKIHTALQYYKTLNKEAVQIKYKKASLLLCLHKDYMEDFVKKCNLVFYQSNSTKTEEWLSTYDLKSIFVGSIEKIALMLQQLQSKMPEAIQYKKSASNNVICLHKDYINKFAELSGLVLQEDKDAIKTPEWLNSMELLNKYISLDKTVLRGKMRELQSEMPYALQWKINGPQRVICLHKDYIKEFCERAGLVLQNDSIKGKKYIFDKANKITVMKYRKRISNKESNTNTL